MMSSEIPQEQLDVVMMLYEFGQKHVLPDQIKRMEMLQKWVEGQAKNEIVTQPLKVLESAKASGSPAAIENSVM